jgi:BirA family biotin operon repressor/biotin-[acetyl-CoA-carboxylase] ligase
MQHYHFEKITSTIEYAKELVNSKENIIVTADYQTAGHGRNGKTWLGLFGENVYFAIGIWHKTPPDNTRLTVFQALGVLAAKQAIIEATGTAGHNNLFLIKYPNDLLAIAPDGSPKKICGVLADHDFLGEDCISTVIGIGINVRQTEFDDEIRNNSISLKVLGYDLLPNALSKLLEKHCERYLALSVQDLHEAWKRELNIVGKEIRIAGNAEQWIAESILDDGRLAVRNKDTGSARLIDNGDSVRYSLI